MKLKQSDDPQAFFKRYGFTQSMTLKHPVHQDEMNFDGLEAEYVSSLEHRISDQEKYIQFLRNQIEYLMNKEYWKWKEREPAPPTARQDGEAG